MRAKFEHNPIMYLSFMEVCKKKKNKKKKVKKMSDLLKDYISGMSGTIYSLSGMCSLPICQHPHSKFYHAPTRVQTTHYSNHVS